jgi:hypothetical protein
LSGERDLARLLGGMRPSLQRGTYLFCSVAEAPESIRERAIAIFREAEGLTLVLEESDAARFALAGEFRAAWITLEIASDLAAVGFLARVSAALAAEEIPCNAIAAFHHDHLFVPAADAERALSALQRLAASSSS